MRRIIAHVDTVCLVEVSKKTERDKRDRVWKEKW